MTSGDDYLEQLGGLSFSGSGGQPLPPSVPDAPLVTLSPITGVGFTAEELESIGGVWLPEQKSGAPFDRNFKASYGGSAGKLGFVISANYEKGWSTRDEIQNFYTGDGQGGVRLNENYRFDSTDEKVRQALAGNLAYRIGINHHLQLKSVFTTLGNAESRFQEGFFSDINNNIRELPHQLSRPGSDPSPAFRRSFLLGSGQEQPTTSSPTPRPSPPPPRPSSIPPGSVTDHWR